MKNIVDITTESSVTNCRKRKRITKTNSIKQENKRRRDSKTDDFLIKKIKKIKESFIEACKSDNVDKVGSMLSFGADVNWRDGKGLSGLHLAADNGYSELLEVLLAEDKINVNLTNKNRNTALMFACSSGHEDIVRRLSQAPGVDLNCRDVHGLTALH